MKTRTKNALTSYCSMFNLNSEEATIKTKEAIDHYNGKRPASWVIDAKDEWYDLLREESEAKYSLYDNEWYCCELLACYDVYSSVYIDLIAKLNLEVSSVLDLGCGLGITSKHLEDALNASVTGTNIKGTKQYLFCESNTMPMTGDHKTAGNVDMVFASEYFEHIHNASDHLLEIIEFNSPKVIVMANAFGAESLGHFEWFYNSGWSSKSFPCDSLVDAKKMGRLFSQILKGAGYAKMKTGFWNSRPNVWFKL